MSQMDWEVSGAGVEAELFFEVFGSTIDRYCSANKAPLVWDVDTVVADVVDAGTNWTLFRLIPAPKTRWSFKGTV